MTRESTTTNRRLLRFNDCHKGERLILVCNGPSLNKTDFSLIKGEIIMGLNKIFLGFKRFKFYPKYYVAINQKVIEQSRKEIEKLNCIRFIRETNNKDCVEESALTYFINSREEATFHRDLSKGFYEGYTVTYAALQIAFYMGFSSIIIIGMDHQYQYTGKPNETKYLSGTDPNHFDPQYFSDQLWDNPDLIKSEHFYRIARDNFERNGREIVDCTVDGACYVFNKRKLRDVLG